MKPSANPKRTLIESLQVGLAWDSQIKKWAERELPNGEVVGRVKNAQTVNYKTLKPVKDGLFCEKIFGPVKDFECACGFKQTRGGFCPQCNVEFTRSEVRRYRLGYFQLPSAVTHVWYLRGRPSYISYLLGIKIKKALALTYGAASLLVNSQNDKILSQEESETFTFSFTTQTLHSIGECKGKTVPRSQIRRYNSNYFLFDKKRAKLIRNFFHSFIYTSCEKVLPSPFTLQSDCENAHFSPYEKKLHPQNIEKQNKQSFHLLEDLALPVSETIPEMGTNLQNFDKEKEDPSSLYSQPENSKSSLLSMKPHDSSINSYITKPFLFSSTIRGGWQPLIVVNLQDKLPVHLSYKKTDSKYYKLKKYLKFSQNMGFYTPSFFVEQNQTRSSSSVKTNWSDETFDVTNGNGLLKIKNGDERTVVIDTNYGGEATIFARSAKHESKTNSFFDERSRTFSQSENVNTIGTDHEKKTKFFFNKSILSNKKKKVRKSLSGIDKNKELSLSTLIFYPIKKEVNKVKGKEGLTKNSPELTKKFYQELDSKFQFLNFVDKTNRQIDFSSLSEKRVDLQDNFEETKYILSFPEGKTNFSEGKTNFSEGKTNFSEGKPQNNPLISSGGSREELTDFRSLFHFIGQPCQLKKKAKFLVHTAFNFSQTRNQIFKILRKEKSIDSVDFGYKLSYYGKDLKDKYRIPNNNLKKKYDQSHLLPYLFSLSCQSKNYQYLQTYSNFFTPTLSDSEKTLLISSYKNQPKKNKFLNLYDSFLKEKFTISTFFSCFDNSSTISLKHLTNSLVMRPSLDYFGEKIVRESPEKLVKFVEETKKFSKNNIENRTLLASDRTIVKRNKFQSENIIQLQNSSPLKNLSATHDQVDDIFGEIPLVLDFCQNRTIRGNKNSKIFQQKKKVLQNKTFTFWELKKKTKLLHDKNLENEYFVQQDRIGKDLQSKFSETKSKAIDLILSFSEGRTKFSEGKPQNEKKKSSGVFNEIKKKERTKKKKKYLLIQNLKLCEESLSKILLKLNEDSPLFLQNISVNSFFNSSKDYKFLRGFLIKKFFFVEPESQLLKDDTFYKQKLRKINQPILSFWKEKDLFNKKDLHFVKQNVPLQKVDLFKSFAEQNFPSEWKAKQQTKRILKTATILRNFKKIGLSPVSSNKWSSLSKKLNQENYLFSIYEVSVQQALGYTCGEAILKILSPIDCYQLESGLKVVLWQINERISEVEDQGFLLKSDMILLNSLRTKKSRTLRRLKIAKILRKTKILPKQMVFSLLPVLPPSLRPIIQLDENIVAVSDCSQIYQKIVQRSNRLSKRMSKYLSYDHCLRLKVLLQQAVDGLIENGKGGSKPLCDNNGRPLKSLSDGLKGKKGRFRQDLLGRRVDYSGRSVIVVGPALKLHQCGLPREMAIELFQPFLIRQLFAKKIVSNIAIAKNYIKKETPIVLEILKQLLRSHPVLLNRAPTLHRLGVQAFQPKLVSGRAILLHPLVCSAFNADFDGDQMAVHIPLSSKARGEAWKILWSRNNILSPATGQPILVPSQDMVLGCYYLTTKKANFLTRNSFGLDKKGLNKQSLIFFNKSNDKMVANTFSQSENGNTFEKDERGKIDFTTGNKNITGNSESQLNQNQSEIFSFETNFDKKEPNRETLISFEKDMKDPIIEHFINQNVPSKGFPTENFVLPKGELRVRYSIRQNAKQLRQVMVSKTDQKSIVMKADKWTGLFFNNSSQVLKDLQQKRLKLHTPIWLKMDRDVEIHKEEQKPLEVRINCCGNFTKIYPGYLRRFYKKEGLFFNENKIKKSEDFYVRTTCGRVMLNQTISPILHQPF